MQPARALLAALLIAMPLGLPATAREPDTELTMTKSQHAAWTALLSKYVHTSADGVNRFDYGALKASAADRKALDAYIAGFETMDLSGSKDAAFAAWANLYNAVTVRYIVSKYPVGSIKDGYLFGGPWKKVTVTAGGREVSLDDIEHRILRPVFKEPRVHYAINCAAVSCPNLMAEAWEPATLDAELDTAARAYVNNPRGVTVTDKGLVVSSIYDWFEADFGGSKDAVIDHLLKYAWSLNDTE